jgi:hypothetical protein
MYDTKFIVKYHDIQEDLNIILKEKEDQYSSQDILDICNKLYRDELCSVFYAEDIIDDKIDKGMQTVFDIMLVNPDFKAIIDKKKELLLLKETKNLELGLDSGSDTINLDAVNLDVINLEILLTLFSENIFYITHKCICQQITIGRIDTELLSTLI